MKIPSMLRRIIEREGRSVWGTARALGIDPASLSRSLQDDSNPEARTIEKILDYFGYEIRFKKSKKHKARERRAPE